MTKPRQNLINDPEIPNADEKTCYVSCVILSLVSLHEDLSFEPVSKTWPFNKGFIHPSKLYASNPSQYRSQVRIRL